MNEIGSRSAEQNPRDLSAQGNGLIAAGGILAAGLASSCCVLPLVLVTLGISGAWIGNLSALEPYRPYFAGVALAFIGLGFRHVYFRTKPDCIEGSCCARPQSAVVTKTVLWTATILVFLALTVSWWAPFFY